MTRGLFITGTDTGAGKTVLAACLLASMRAAGRAVRAFKPVVTGLDDVPPSRADDEQWPADHELLAAAAAMDPEEVSPLRYGPAASPHLAAQLAGEEVDPEMLKRAARAGPPGATLVVEGVGGLLVPFTERFSVSDLALDLGLPLLLAARPSLGTINHTLLTLSAARGAGLDVRAVVLTPWPAEPSTLERSNRETIAQLGGVAVETLASVESPDLATLARAGATLPWREWISADCAVV